jgi:hypothetical protein
MKKIPLYALVLLLVAGVASAESNLSISLSSDDDLATMGPRRDVRDARVAIRTRDRSTMLLLMNDVVAVQLSDAALAKLQSEKKNEDAGFFEELFTAGVRIAIGKSVEYPLANIRSVEYRDGVLHLVNAKNEPVFAELKVNGTDVLRDFSSADAARFINAFRAEASRRSAVGRRP